MLLFLAIRVPLILLGIPLTLQEVKAMVLGERLSENFMLYRDVYDTTAPLSAALFWVVDVAFGRNILMYRIIASTLIFIQGLRLNLTLNTNGVLNEKTYLPALLYFIFGSIFFEFDTLSPLLLGMTFLIFSIQYLIVAPKEGISNPRLFKGGFMLGIAALCYLPFLLFLIFGFFAVVFFAFNTFRSFLLFLCGLLFPYIVAFTYFLYADALPNFIQYNILSAWQFDIDLLLPGLDLLKIVALPILFLLFAVTFCAIYAPGLNYQLKFFQLMLIWLPIAALVTIAGQEISAITWLLFLPAFTYFATFLFLRSNFLWLTEPLFLILFGFAILTRYNTLLPPLPYVAINTSGLTTQSASKYYEVTNARILVLGDDINFYVANKAATPYINWQLAQEDFGQLNTYYAVFKISQNIATAKPEYIVDEKGLMPELRYKAPEVFGRYKHIGQNHLYKRID